MIARALIVITASIALLITVASKAQDNNPFSGARSIEIVMTKVETCDASQYGVGDGYHGKRAADGSIFNTWAMTAAHKTRAFGSHVTVTNLANGKSVVVKISDRGPFVKGRCIDLSRAAADAIGMDGTARVTVE